MALPQTQPEATTNNLILDSLEVKNFRAFRHLQIPKLGRVNLITGKNNVGKSSLLEALWLYAEKGSPLIMWRFFRMRDELRQGVGLNGRSAYNGFDGRSIEENDLSASVRFLFHGRKEIQDGDSVEEMRIGSSNSLEDTLSIGLNWLKRPLLNTEVLDETNMIADAGSAKDSHAGGMPVFHIRVGGRNALSGMHVDWTSQTALSKTGPEVPCHYISTNGLDRSQIGFLWDRVALTSMEDDVIRSLKIIDKNIERVNLVGEQGQRQGRIAFVKVQEQEEPISLRSLGDGVNRLFGIILSMVNAKDGALLIDEVENGLHYSVLPDVWRLIFETARRLNVQVFATTHSWDCIEAFQKAADEDEQDEGVLVRLQNKDGDVTATVFDERRLAVVTREGIEVR